MHGDGVLDMVTEGITRHIALRRLRGSLEERAHGCQPASWSGVSQSVDLRIVRTVCIFEHVFELKSTLLTALLKVFSLAADFIDVYSAASELLDLTPAPTDLS